MSKPRTRTPKKPAAGADPLPEGAFAINHDHGADVYQRLADLELAASLSFTKKDPVTLGGLFAPGPDGAQPPWAHIDRLHERLTDLESRVMAGGGEQRGPDGFHQSVHSPGILAGGHPLTMGPSIIGSTRGTRSLGSAQPGPPSPSRSLQERMMEIEDRFAGFIDHVEKQFAQNYQRLGDIEVAVFGAPRL